MESEDHEKPGFYPHWANILSLDFIWFSHTKASAGNIGHYCQWCVFVEHPIADGNYCPTVFSIHEYVKLGPNTVCFNLTENNIKNTPVEL